MKVFHNGFNLYRQFPECDPLLVNYRECVLDGAEDIEVNHTYAVLLVANTVVYQSGEKREILEFDDEIKQITSNEERILVLLRGGDLFKICKSDLKAAKVPNFLDPDEDNDKICKISCGAKLCVALTEKSNLYNIPNKLDFKNKDIVDVKTGREHCLLLDSDGKVYSFGRGSRGQLGHGSLDDETEPKFVEALGGIKIVFIAAGGWHSCALSKDGDLYTWGWNGNGQLGLSSNQNAVSVMASPHVVDLDKNVVRVACGSRHTVILLDDGQLYGCGWNKYKQLNNSSQEMFREVTYLQDFSKEVVKSVKCGPWNTLVLCDQ